MESAQRNKKEHTNDITTNNKKAVKADAVDPLSPQFEETWDESPPEPVSVAATLVVPPIATSPSDDDLQEEKQANLGHFWCRPLYLALILTVCVVTAGAIIIALLVNNRTSSPSSTSPSPLQSVSPSSLQSVSPSLAPSSNNQLYYPLALGGYHTCIVTDENKLMCWGNNLYGQVGDGTTTSRSIPKTIELGFDVFAEQISLGFWHTCAVTNENELKCWGSNSKGQLGDGTTDGRSIPTTIDLGSNVYAQKIALGWDHTCAITNKDELKCWGNNWYGQVGDGTTTDRSIPTSIHIGLNVHAKEVALGRSHTCTGTGENELKCWGWNYHGQLGDGTTTDSIIPINIDLGSNVYAQKIALGDKYTCSVTNKNELKCWGQYFTGEVAGGLLTTDNYSIPTPIDLGSNVYAQQISVGNGHNCVVTNEKKLKCWGYNYYGQVGDGTTTTSNIPTIIDLGSDVYPQQIALGRDHTCVVTNEKKLKCWGRNDYGQVGDGTTIDKNTPTLV